MFNKKKPNPEIIRNLKKIFSNENQIPDTSILSIAELTCHEPNCPPIETIITERAVSYTHLTLPTKRIV